MNHLTKVFPQAVTDNNQETIAAAETYLADFQMSIMTVLEKGLFLPEERLQYHELLMHLVGAISEGMYFRGLRNGMVASEHGLDLSDMLSQQPALTVIDGGKKSE
jgi:hypothetical protein